MAFYQFTRNQLVKAPIEAVWDFISNPSNLKRITPDYMGFKITSKNLPKTMYSGMIITYLVSPLLGIKTTWVTEITQIKPLQYFIDEQRVGPYKIWHYQHFITAKGSHTLMTDIVSYQPPLGVLGQLANHLIIRSKLEEIFNYRASAIDNYFSLKP